MQPKINTKYWGKIGHKEVKLVSISTGLGKGEVSLTNYGARIVSAKVPDRKGSIGEVTLGHDTSDKYLRERAYFGCTIGRVANRIANAEFDLDGVTYSLAKNNLERHHLHGGFEGFDAKVWEIRNLGEEGEKAKIEFSYTSPNGEEGYPGTLSTQVKYVVSENQIEINYSARTDKPTIVNLTNHTYWNLAGVGTKIYGHQATIAASTYLETDDEMIPTGKLRRVEETPLDFRERKSLRNPLEALGGIDHNYVLDKGMKFGLAAQVYDPSTGRKVTVETDQPAIVFYTGNHLEGRSAWDKPCIKHQAFCLETQQFSDAIHHPDFPPIVLRPGETYSQSTRYTFTTDVSRGHQISAQGS
ncbi:MAG: aldose epimerase family protein [Promethearchaeati archaeon SRVP18_Atabeyarchaeia-1]